MGGVEFHDFGIFFASWSVLCSSENLSRFRSWELRDSVAGSDPYAGERLFGCGGQTLAAGGDERLAGSANTGLVTGKGQSEIFLSPAPSDSDVQWTCAIRRRRRVFGSSSFQNLAGRKRQSGTASDFPLR